MVERDPDFARLLRERFQERPNFDIVEGDVRDLASILADRGIDRVDHVISGLPVPSFPKALQRALFRPSSKVLRRDGTYNQITEIPWIYWRFYRGYFHDVNSRSSRATCRPAGRIFAEVLNSRQ